MWVNAWGPHAEGQNVFFMFVFVGARGAVFGKRNNDLFASAIGINSRHSNLRTTQPMNSPHFESSPCKVCTTIHD